MPVAVKRLLSLAHLTVIELSPPDMVTAAHDAGYDTVDFRLAPVTATDREYPMLGNTPMLRETKRRLEGTGLKVFDVELIKLTGGMALSQFDRLFETAAELGAKRIKTLGHDQEPVVVSLLSDLCERIKPYGLSADLEFMVFSQVKTLQQAVRIAEAVGAPNLGVLVDALHLSRSGGSPDDVAALPPSHFPYVHLCDAPSHPPTTLEAVIQEARHGRLLPGRGGLPLVELLRALPPGLPVSIEIPLQGAAGKLPAAVRAQSAINAARELLAIVDGRDQFPTEGSA